MTSSFHEWKTYRLGDLAQYINGKAFKPEEWRTSGRPIIRIQNLTDADKPFNYCDQAVESRYLVNDGDLLISWSATLGSFIWNRGPGVLNQHIFKALPNGSLVEKEFLHFLMLNTLDEMADHAHGIAMKHITKGKFEAIEVSIPNLLEQRRIMAQIRNCLERVNEVEKLRKQAKLEAACLEFAAFHDAIEEGINRRGWPLGKLGDVASSFRYGTSEKAHTEQVGTPILRMGNIANGYFNYRNLKFIQLKGRDLSKYRLKFGDVLINRTNSLELVGKAATFDQEDGDWVYASYLVCVDVDRSRAVPEFVTAVINSRMGRDYVLATARRAIGMVNINAKEMARFPMPLPRLKDQVAIVERLRAVRVCAQSLRNEIDSPGIEQLRTAVLRRAFAGEL